VSERPGPPGDLDEIRRELVAIMDGLAALPADAYLERAELKARREELRAQAARFAAADETDRARIRERIKFLERRRDEILSGTVSQSAGAQTGMGGGIDPEYVHRLNRDIKAGGGLAGIDAELERLRRILADE
jgi:hypothetical protein